jgi:hypothetical protein
MRYRRTKSAVVAAAVVVILTHLALAQAPAGQAVGSKSFPGKVVETMDAGQYTYVLVDDGAKKIWAAAPHFTVAVGDAVVVPAGMLMKNFKSESLHRTFEEVYFVNSIAKAGEAVSAGAPAQPRGALASAHAGLNGGGAAANAPVELSGIAKVPNGQTVAELYAQKAALTGKDVAVRGRVVKFTPAVMGKNWMHVQDGSGSAGDLTVSTAASAKIGDLVVVRGKLGADRDLGAGYRYDIIVEDGSVSIE